MSRIAKVTAAALGAGAVVLGGAGTAMADADAHSAAVGSPGVISGNVVAVPVNVPVNLCGNTVDVVGLLNPAFGNSCKNVAPHGGYGS
ncbi:Chaplin OS=Streptomyces alboniger OX=132473 GN=CP975_18875 PE=4 SV=1 [Streptomyces alboniger]